MIYFWGLFSLFAFSKTKHFENNEQGVSVVICARNEYQNLEKNLPLILEQEYPTFEVVVVNDRSEDDTEGLLLDLSHKYPHLKIVHIEENLNFFHGKKFALSIGIKSAKYDIILLTDADCRPASKKWISLMQAPFSDKNVSIVLGYGAYEQKKGLLNKIIRWDTLFIAMQYFSFAKAGIPYMGVGRNLAYRKNLFLESGGFVSHYDIPSGDDDLFVNQNANRKNTQIVSQSESHTISESKKSLSEWLYQKKRHLSTGFRYKFKHKLLLSLFHFSTLMFYILSALIMLIYVNLYTFIICSSLIFLRWLTQWIITKKTMLKLKEKNFLLFSPFFELFLLLLNGIIMLTAHNSKQKHQWK